MTEPDGWLRGHRRSVGWLQPREHQGDPDVVAVRYSPDGPDHLAVEVTVLGQPCAPVLQLDAHQWAVFLAAVKAGEFDPHQPPAGH